MSRITRRLLVLFLSLVLVFSVTPATARTFSGLGELQRYIEHHSPADLAASGPHYIELEGAVVEMHALGVNNHWQLTLQVDDPQAITPLGADGPQLIVHFRLHLDEPPFRIGDTITVFGTVNELYSSVILPEVLAKTINGTEDY